VFDKAAITYYRVVAMPKAVRHPQEGCELMCDHLLKQRLVPDFMRLRELGHRMVTGQAVKSTKAASRPPSCGQLMALS
jgi:hypothetical protein